MSLPHCVMPSWLNVVRHSREKSNRHVLLDVDQKYLQQMKACVVDPMRSTPFPSVDGNSEQAFII